MSPGVTAHRFHPAQRGGEIRGDTIPCLIHALYQERATGILTVTDGDMTKTLHLGDG